MQHFPALARMSLLAAAAALLAACADSDLAGSGPCQVTKVAELKLERRSGVIVAPGRINTSEVAMLVDTGAQKSMITGEITARLGLLGDWRNGSIVSGVGGQGIPQNDALVDDLEFGPYQSGATHFPVIGIPLAAGSGKPLGGVVGGDVLSRYDLDLDVAHGRLALYEVRHCAGRFLPWSKPYSGLAMDVTWNNDLLLPVTVDGVALTAQLDTGASATLLDSVAAEKAGVTEADIAGSQANRGFGAAGVDVREVTHRFRELVVGPDHWRNITLHILDRPLRGSDMLLGQDYLVTRHVWISYRTHQFFVETPAS